MKTEGRDHDRRNCERSDFGTRFELETHYDSKTEGETVYGSCSVASDDLRRPYQKLWLGERNQQWSRERREFYYFECG